MYPTDYLKKKHCKNLNDISQDFNLCKTSSQWQQQTILLNGSSYDHPSTSTSEKLFSAIHFTLWNLCDSMLNAIPSSGLFVNRNLTFHIFCLDCLFQHPILCMISNFIIMMQSPLTYC